MLGRFLYIFFALILYIFITGNNAAYPIAFFHGIADGCNFNVTSSLISYLKKTLNTEVKCIEIGNGFVTSWFKMMKKQAEEACEKIKVDPLFQGNFTIFGVSQGTLISRYVIQNCDIKGKIVNYVSFDGPQMGIGSLPKINCPVVCDWINSAVAKFIYNDYFQRNIAPAGYFKYKYSFQEYLNGSSFLADLNNERPNKTELYKSRFSSLEKLLLIKNKNDTTITPIDSSWFQFYDQKGENIVPLNQSDFYISDYIGLRYLIENNKVSFAEFEGDHVIFTWDEIDQHIITFLS